MNRLRDVLRSEMTRPSGNTVRPVNRTREQQAEVEQNIRTMAAMFASGRDYRTGKRLSEKQLKE